MKVETILIRLRDIADPSRLIHMEKYGINVGEALGVSIQDLRRLAKDIPKNHSLALELWDTGIHEAKMLACYIDEIKEVTESQLETWVKDFNSWDLCDQCCSNHFDRTPFAYNKAVEWSKRNDEFVKRAGFVLMATLSVHDKKAENKQFNTFFDRIKDECDDDRVYVKKAVNWALRQMGKRNQRLNEKAILVGQDLLKIESKTARWIARDALRELNSDKIQDRLKHKDKKDELQIY